MHLFFFQAEDGIRDRNVTGVQTCALPISHRKLYPALFNLYEQGLIHDNFAVIGTARRPWSHEYLREQVSDAIHETHDTVDENELKAFASHFYYQSHDVSNVEHYEILKN